MSGPGGSPGRFSRAVRAFLDDDAPPPAAQTPAPDNRAVLPKKKPWWANRLFGGLLGAGVCLAAIAWILMRDPYSGARDETGQNKPRLGRVVGWLGQGSAPQDDKPADEKPADKKPEDPPPRDAVVRIDPKDLGQTKSTGRFGRDQQARREQAAAALEEGELARALKVSTMRGVKSGAVHDEHLKMRPTTEIPCVMNTFTDNGSGVVYGSCTVTHRGGMNATNTVPLIPRDTVIEIVGERTASQGENRLFLTAARAIGRYEGGHHFQVDIMSAVADALGATGVKGYRDTQFGQRLWGSVMLGIVGDAAAVGQNALIAGGLPGGRALGGAGNAAATSLRYSVNIPVHYKMREGEEIAIVLNRWADFSEQLELEALR